MILSVIGLAVFLLGYRFVTKPAVAAVLSGGIILFFLASCLDPNFNKIVTKPDNVPIVMMMCLMLSMPEDEASRYVMEPFSTAKTSSSGLCAGET